MTKETSLQLQAATIGAVLTSVAFMIGLRLSNTDLQKIGSICTVVTALVGIVGVGVLVIYTRETFILRKAAEEQNETDLMPVLRLDLHSTNDKSTDPLDIVFQIENIGYGPAVRASVQPIVSPSHKIDIRILEDSLIQERTAVRCRMEQNGSYIPGKDRTLYFLKLDVQNKFPESLFSAIEFQSLSGRRYRTHHEILWDKNENMLRTEFRGMEKIV
jgi:hypothetical protein